MSNPLIELAEAYAKMPNGGARLNVAQAFLSSEPATFGKIKVSDGWTCKATFDTNLQATHALLEAGFARHGNDWKLREVLHERTGD